MFQSIRCFLIYYLFFGFLKDKSRKKNTANLLFDSKPRCSAVVGFASVRSMEEHAIVIELWLKRNNRSLTSCNRVLEAFRRPISVTLRTRLRGEVYSREGQLERVFYSLNEFIVNRGISGVLSTLEVSQSTFFSRSLYDYIMTLN